MVNGFCPCTIVFHGFSILFDGLLPGKSSPPLCQWPSETYLNEWNTKWFNLPGKDCSIGVLSVRERKIQLFLPRRKNLFNPDLEWPIKLCVRRALLPMEKVFSSIGPFRRNPQKVSESTVFQKSDISGSFEGFSPKWSDWAKISIGLVPFSQKFW